MSICLIRHGETALNVARVFQPAATPLNERGIAQADAVARRLATMGIGAILSSDMPRAQRTAEAIAAATGLPIEFSTLLHERNFGDWRGHSHAALGLDPLARAEAPPGGESVAEFECRVAQAFALIVQRRTALRRGQLAVVSHGLVLRAILQAHVERADGEAAPLQMGNTSVSIIGATAPHRVSLMNCTVHLDTDALRDNPHALSGA